MFTNVKCVIEIAPKSVAFRLANLPIVALVLTRFLQTRVLVEDELLQKLIDRQF